MIQMVKMGPGYPLEKDFERLNAAAVERVYQEVSRESEILQEAVESLGRWPWEGKARVLDPL